MRLPLSQLLSGTGGALLTPSTGADLFAGVSTDSRTVRPGEVFFALRGPRHDGHDHLRAAWERGAAAAVVERGTRPQARLLPPLPLVLVDDTTAALQSLARWWRLRRDLTLVAVAGSVGKTTTKEMTAALLSAKGPTARTLGNLNNHIGLPLTLLSLEDHHRFAVVEMGASGRGEIALLASLALPRAAVLTRLGWAHLEGFGGPEALVEEKGAVLDVLPPDGWAALPAEDEAFPSLAKRAPCRVISYGFSRGDVRAEEVEVREEDSSFRLVTPQGSVGIRLRGFGRHLVEDALAAVAAALPAGVALEEVAACLAAWSPLASRGGVVTPWPGVRFIDDTYNANPLSMTVVLEGLAAFRAGAVTVAVLGGMAELGAFREEGHRLVGRKAAELMIDYLVAVGPEAPLYAEGALAGGMPPARVISCPDHAAAAAALRPLLVAGSWALFKGSRAARMEEVMAAFLPAAAAVGGGR